MTQVDNIYLRMQEGEPFKSYKKTILAKVYLNILDPFTRKPMGLIVEGNPTGNTKEDCIVDVWDEMEDSYFQTHNKKQFQKGNVIEYQRKKAKKEKSVNEVTDEDLEKILSSKFFAFQKSVNEFTSVAPIFRLLEKSKELEKSEKYQQVIENKLSELQLEDFQPTEED